MSATPITISRADLLATAAHLADRFRSPLFRQSDDFPSEELRALTRAGLLSIALPDTLGGLGIGLECGLRADLLPALKEIGRGNLPLGRLFEGHVNALLLLQMFGTAQQMEKVADDVLLDDCVFGVWNTGPQGSPQLTPTENGHYRLAGSKTFATGAIRIQRAIITAALPDGGWQMCLVPINAQTCIANPDSWTPLGMKASESFSVTFPDVLLPQDSLIGRPGDYYSEPTFTAGAFRFSAVHLGGAEALFAACCEFVGTPGREADPFHLRRLGEMQVLIESGRQWLEKAGAWLEASFTDLNHLAVHAQMMRIATEEICTRVIQLTQLCAGARGLASSEPFARTLSDLQMYLRQAGFDQAYQVVGRHAVQTQEKHG